MTETSFKLAKTKQRILVRVIEEFRDLRHDCIQLSSDVMRLVLFSLSWLHFLAGSPHEVARVSAPGLRPRNLTSPVVRARVSLAAAVPELLLIGHTGSCLTSSPRPPGLGSQAHPLVPGLGVPRPKTKGLKRWGMLVPQRKNRSGAFRTPGSKYREARRGSYSPSSTFCFYRRAERGWGTHWRPFSLCLALGGLTAVLLWDPDSAKSQRN